LFVVYLVFILAYFQKGSGDTSENGERVLDSCMCKEVFLHAAIQLPFTICKRAVDGLLKHFSRVVNIFLKGFICSLH
jgi:hypothetical protein